MKKYSGSLPSLVEFIDTGMSMEDRQLLREAIKESILNNRDIEAMVASHILKEDVETLESYISEETLDAAFLFLGFTPISFVSDAFASWYYTEKAMSWNETYQFDQGWYWMMAGLSLAGALLVGVPSSRRLYLSFAKQTTKSISSFEKIWGRLTVRMDEIVDGMPGWQGSLIDFERALAEGGGSLTRQQTEYLSTQAAELRRTIEAEDLDAQMLFSFLQRGDEDIFRLIEALETEARSVDSVVAGTLRSSNQEQLRRITDAFSDQRVAAYQQGISARGSRPATDPASITSLATLRTVLNRGYDAVKGDISAWERLKDRVVLEQGGRKRYVVKGLITGVWKRMTGATLDLRNAGRAVSILRGTRVGPNQMARFRTGIIGLTAELNPASLPGLQRSLSGLPTGVGGLNRLKIISISEETGLVTVRMDPPTINGATIFKADVIPAQVRIPEPKARGTIQDMMDDVQPPGSEVANQDLPDWARAQGVSEDDVGKIVAEESGLIYTLTDFRRISAEHPELSARNPSIWRYPEGDSALDQIWIKDWAWTPNSGAVSDNDLVYVIPDSWIGQNLASVEVGMTFRSPAVPGTSIREGDSILLRSETAANVAQPRQFEVPASVLRNFDDDSGRVIQGGLFDRAGSGHPLGDDFDNAAAVGYNSLFGSGWGAQRITATIATVGSQTGRLSNLIRGQGSENVWMPASEGDNEWLNLDLLDALPPINPGTAPERDEVELPSTPNPTDFGTDTADPGPEDPGPTGSRGTTGAKGTTGTSLPAE